MAQGSGFSSRGALALPELRRLASPRIGSGAGGASAAADQLGGLARRLNVVGGGLFEQDLRDQLDEEARAGEQAGFGAARSGETLAARDSGFFGRRQDQAFNRAAEVAYTQGLQVQIEEQRQQLELEHEADPDGFMQAWDRYQADVLKTAPAGVRQNLALDLEHHGNQGDFRLAAQRQRRVEVQAAFNTRMRAEQLGTIAAQKARQAGDYGAAAAELGELTGSVQEAVAAGWLDDGEAAALLLRYRDQAIDEGYFGAFELAPSAGALRDFLEDETPELAPERKDRIAGRMRVALANRESEARAARTEIGAEVRQVEKALDAGLDVEGLEDLVRRAEGTGLEAGLRTRVAIAAKTRVVAQLPRDQQLAALQGAVETVARLRQQPVAAGEADETIHVVAQLERFAGTVRSIIETSDQAVADGKAIDRAAELGLVEDLVPLDLSTREGLSETLNARVRQARKAEAHFGIQPGNVLLDGEVQELSQLMRAGAVQTNLQVAVLSTMKEQLGPERMGAVLARVSKDAPTAMTFAAGAPPLLMNDMLAGRAILADNPKAAPSLDTAAVRDTVSKVYGDVLNDSPFTLRQATEAARWLYARWRFAEGDVSGELDVGTWDEALRAAVGGIVEWENDAGLLPFLDDTSKLIPPRPGMTSAEFQSLMDGFTDEDLRATGQIPRTEMGLRVGADEIRGLAKLKSIGDGQYAVTIAGFSMLGEDGRPYVLDLGAVLRAKEAQGWKLRPQMTVESFVDEQMRLQREAMERARALSDQLPQAGPTLPLGEGTRLGEFRAAVEEERRRREDIRRRREEAERVPRARRIDLP